MMIGLKLRAFSFLVVVSVALLAWQPQNSVASTWYDLPYDHFSKDEPLVELLHDFSSTIGIPIIVSERLRNEEAQFVNGHFKNVTAEMFLLKLSNLYQIVWYFDGHMLFIYHASEMRSELLHFSDAKAQGVKNTLKRLGVWDPRFNWREMREKNLLFISGPPRYIELVKEVSNVIEISLKKQKDTTYEVKVFPLNYAWADDRMVSHRGKEIVIPGVATTIKKILGNGSNTVDYAKRFKQHFRTPSTYRGLSSSQGLKGTGLTGGKPSYHQQSMDADDVAAHSDNLHTPGESSYIEANSQQNAVIVYDLASRMPMYSKLVKSLDVKAEQIEIEVSIIDINTRRLSEFGIDWRQGDPDRGAYGFGSSQNIERDFGGLSHTFGLNGGQNQSISSILSGNADYFLGKVRVLANDGDGQVLSQPSVMTMNNVEAIIDHSTTFYVRLEGEREVDLVPISAGSVLKVIPRIIDTEDPGKIHLNVEIEDGRVASPEQDDVTSVDDIPTVVVSKINTQAVIDKSSSLLVGGYYYDSSDKTGNRVPILGSIPVIKWFFSNEAKKREKIARLFLITPRIVDHRIAVEKGNQIRAAIDEERSFQNLKYSEPKYEVMKYSNPAGLNIYD